MFFVRNGRVEIDGSRDKTAYRETAYEQSICSGKREQQLE